LQDRALPIPASQHFAFGAWEFDLYTVAFRAKAIDFVEHPLQQGFGGAGSDTSLLQLQNLLALPADLDAHAFDFGSDVIEVRHVSRCNGRVCT
jgi:hypothetical protein